MEQQAHRSDSFWSKGLLVDTNLLVLFFIGSHDRTRIGRFKRTKAFTESDYDLLLNVFRKFHRIATTPHILTEVSNLLGQLPEELKRAHYQAFAAATSSLEESYTASTKLTKCDHFPIFGLTDSGIIESAKGKYSVLTDDLSLYAYLIGVGVNAINFNHLRMLS